MPQSYFDEVAAGALAGFGERARLQRNERLLDSFPTTFVERRLRPMDRAPVSRLYRNWLSYLRARRRLASRSSASPQQHRGDAPQPAEGVS